MDDQTGRVVMADLTEAELLARANPISLQDALACVDLAGELGIDPQTAVSMWIRGTLHDTARRSRWPGYTRLEPDIGKLDGLPAWEAWQPIGALSDGDTRYATDWLADWLRDPVGPHYEHPDVAGLLLAACEPGSPAQVGLAALLWEAQDG